MVDTPCLQVCDIQAENFVSHCGHLKTILERCKNHTLTTSMCNHPHAPAHTILENGVVMFADRVGARSVPTPTWPPRNKTASIVFTT